MSRLIFTFFCLLATLSATAQEWRVSGRVLDGYDDSNGLPMAQLQLLTKDSVVVDKTVANNHGDFDLKASKAGRYIIRASFIGYEPQTLNITFSPNRRWDYKRLTLQPRNVALASAEVVGMSSLLTIKADTFEYHTSALRLPPGATLSQVVKQLPGFALDESGQLTFQGKVVEGVLVGGKELFDDTKTALANLPADAVESLKAYEKTDDKIAFRGGVDHDKKTVVDLKVKKEYFHQWSMNFDAGVGTDNRYTGRAFVSTFSEKQRLAIIGSINNISEEQYADENGNWQYYNMDPSGRFSTRILGGYYGFDNGREPDAAGYLKLVSRVGFEYKNGTYQSLTETNSFLADGGSLNSYNSWHRNNRDVFGMFQTNLTLNIDSLTQLNSRLYFRHGATKSRVRSLLSSYSGEPEVEDRVGALTEVSEEEAVALGGVSGNATQELSRSRKPQFAFHADLTRRLNDAGRSISLDAYIETESENQRKHELGLYRFFSAGVPNDTLRNFSRTPERTFYHSWTLEFDDAIGKHFSYHLEYDFTMQRSHQANSEYSLARDEFYRNLTLPIEARPAILDAALLDAANSVRSHTTSRFHELGGSLDGKWEKLELGLWGNYTMRRKGLRAWNDGNYFYLHDNSGTYFYNARVKLKPSASQQYTLNYNESTISTDIMQRLGLTNTSDPMTRRVSNPNLKNGVRHVAYFSFNNMNKRTGLTFYGTIYGQMTDRATAYAQQIDAATGIKTVYLTNVSGNFSYSANVSAEIPLDTLRRFTLTLNPVFNFTRTASYTGAAASAMGQSIVRSSQPSFTATLRYRHKVWSIVAKGSWGSPCYRYDNLRTYNQRAHRYEASLTPQVDLPWGMRVNTDFTVSRTDGYANSLLNVTQYIWNASISQTLLKSKALTLQLQAADLLHSRKNVRASVDPSYRLYSRYESVLSYVMLHVIYRLSLK